MKSLKKKEEAAFTIMMCILCKVNLLKILRKKEKKIPNFKSNEAGGEVMDVPF